MHMQNTLILVPSLPLSQSPIHRILFHFSVDADEVIFTLVHALFSILAIEKILIMGNVFIILILVHPNFIISDCCFTCLA